MSFPLFLILLQKNILLLSLFALSHHIIHSRNHFNFSLIGALWRNVPSKYYDTLSLNIFLVWFSASVAIWSRTLIRGNFTERNAKKLAFFSRSPNLKLIMEQWILLNISPKDWCIKLHYCMQRVYQVYWWCDCLLACWWFYFECGCSYHSYRVLLYFWLSYFYYCLKRLHISAVLVKR